jgi:hypothetical protein
LRSVDDHDTRHGWVTPEQEQPLSPRDFSSDPQQAASLHDAVSAELSEIAREGQHTCDEEGVRDLKSPSGRRVGIAALETASMSSAALFDSPGHTLIIIDWDDTLFPTSWMTRQYGAFEVWSQGNLDATGFLEQMEPADADALHELDCCARAVIITASELGQVACVTLAQRPWVHRCLKDFMPGLWEVWQQLGIEVSYARERCSATRVTSFTDLTPGPRRGVPVPSGVGGREIAAGQQMNDVDEHSIMVQGELCSQKRRAMLRVIRKFYEKNSWKNVVSIGDGPAEREALLDLGLQHKNPISSRSGSPSPFRVKTVKLIDGPDCTTLIAEHQIVQAWLPPMVGYTDDFDVNLDESEDMLLDQQSKLYEGSSNHDRVVEQIR